MHQVQKTNIFKKLLKVIFRVVTLYACESLKAQSKYPDVYSWFEKCNKLLEEEIRLFLHQNSKNTSVRIDTIHLDPSINLSLNEEDIVFIFAQSYWDSYQHQVFDYNKALFKELGLEKDQFKEFFNQTQMKLYSQFHLDFSDKIEFSQKYNFSAFVGKDRFTNVLFQYFKLLYLTENKYKLYKNIDLGTEFLKLIKIIPYFSITSRSSIVGFKTYPTKMGKKYYSELKLPLGVQAGALVDNMIHFIFNYLTELFYFKELRDESGNFDINLHRKVIWDYSKEESEFDSINKENEYYESLNECINIIENLLQSLPIKLTKIFTNNKEKSNEIAPLLLSTLFANFIRKYDLELAHAKEGSDLSEVYALPLECNAKKIKAFYKFLENGFKDIDLHVKFNHLKNADDCQLYLVDNGIELINMSGKNIKDNFANHKKFFNYE